MAVTYTVVDVVETEVTTNVPTIDRSNLKIQSQFRGNDGSIETIYVLKTGTDEDRQLSLRVGYYPKRGSQNISISIETGFTGVDENDVLVSDGRIRATLALTIPKSQGVGNAVAILQLIGNLYSCWYDGVTSADPNTNVLAMLGRGIAEIDA